MTALLSLLQANAQGIGQNLAASVLWVPVTLLGNHLITRWHVRRLHRHLTGKP